MRKLSILSTLCFACTLSFAQKPTGVIEQLLQSISNFQSRENKRDSALSHPLGSNTEPDFLRRYSFYDSVYTVLNKIDKALLSFDDQINLELVRYDVEDE